MFLIQIIHTLQYDLKEPNLILLIIFDSHLFSHSKIILSKQ